MDNMEHAIEHAARALFLSDRGDTLPAGFPERQWDEGHAVKDDYLRRARALAEAGLLAPAPEPRADLADAWDEGYKDCFLSIDGSGWRELEDNPYRKGGRL